MTDEEKNQAAAYIKLQADVEQLIVGTVQKALHDYGSPLHTSIAASLLYSQAFKDQVKKVIKERNS